MHQPLIPLYGPFAINSFGLFIVSGILIFSYLFLKDPKRSALISIDQYCNALSLGIIVGLLGARLLYFIEAQGSLPWTQFFFLWEGGLSLLGGVIGIVLIIPLYLKKKHIPFLPLADLASIYAPLLQSIARWGCFFAGCCYGIPTTHWWGIVYSPLCTLALHPTQLYSSILLFFIFLGMYYGARFLFKKPGQLLCIYLMTMGVERFITDFWRQERTLLVTPFALFSVAQLLAILTISGALGLFIVFTIFNRSRHESV